ncbi:hypothetical protein Hanom_Chr17g01544711 [Helianthus anomalus]
MCSWRMKKEENSLRFQMHKSKNHGHEIVAKKPASSPLYIIRNRKRSLRTVQEGCGIIK